MLGIGLPLVCAYCSIIPLSHLRDVTRVRGWGWGAAWIPWSLGAKQRPLTSAPGQVAPWQQMRCSESCGGQQRDIPAWRPLVSISAREVPPVHANNIGRSAHNTYGRTYWGTYWRRGTDGQRDGQTDGRTEGRTGGLREGRTDWRTDTGMDKQIDRQSHRTLSKVPYTIV